MNIKKIITIGEEAKKESAKNIAFTKLWKDECAGSYHIGHVNNLLSKYQTIEKSVSLDDAIEKFITTYTEDGDPLFAPGTIKGSVEHGRTWSQIKQIAEYISRRCNEKGITFQSGLENDIKRLACLVTYHACVETVMGKYGEMIVENYFNSFGLERKNLTNIKTTKWDTYGVDILLYRNNSIFRFVQVKPISFILGCNKDIVEDRRKCISINQTFIDRYIKNHPSELHPNAINKIKYCFYDRDGRFFNFKKNWTDDGVFVEYKDFCNDNGTSKLGFKEIKRLPKINLTNFKKKESADNG